MLLRGFLFALIIDIKIVKIVTSLLHIFFRFGAIFDKINIFVIVIIGFDFCINLINIRSIDFYSKNKIKILSDLLLLFFLMCFFYFCFILENFANFKTKRIQKF